MPGEKMHPSLLRVNQHTERVRKELKEMTSEMNHFYQRYSGLDEENEFLREYLVSLLNRINDEAVSKELSDLGQEIRTKLREFESEKDPQSSHCPIQSSSNNSSNPMRFPSPNSVWFIQSSKVVE